MTDHISRQAAIEHLKNRLYETELNSNAKYPYYAEMADNRVSVWLGEVPTIEPGRDIQHAESISLISTVAEKHGKWETVDDWDGDCHYQCSFCGEEWFLNEGTPSENNMNFCPNCGAKMADDWEEPEINPCRGCDDYDGRGGCKSHGGCGAERSEEWMT